MAANEVQLQQAFDTEIKNGEVVLYVGNVRKLHDSGKGGDKRIFVLTKNHARYYKIKRNPIPDRSRQLSEITEIKELPNRIELYFKGTEENTEMLRFETTEAQFILNVLKNFFFRIMTNPELEEIKLNINDPVRLPRLMTYYAYERFLYLDRRFHLNNHETLNKKLKFSYLNHLKTILFTNDDMIGDHIQSFMKSLAFNHHIESIYFPFIGQN